VELGNAQAELQAFLEKADDHVMEFYDAYTAYQDADDEISGVVQKGFGFNFSNNLSFGVYYAF
jgi:hypothetical protein